MAPETEETLFGHGSTAAGRRIEATLAAAREKLAGLEKFVTGAVVAPQGKADVGTFLPLVRRLAAVGLVTTFAILVPDGEAQAWGRPVGAGYGMSSPGMNFQAFRHHRREVRRERNQQMLAAGAGLVGGLLLGGVLGNGNALGLNNGYRGYAQPTYRNPAAYGGYGGGYGYDAPAYRPPVAPYGGYGAYGGSGGGLAARGPSGAFTTAAKTLIAARVGSAAEADRIYDRFLLQAEQCTMRLGPSAQCIVRFQEVSLDLGRGEFTAAENGQPVVVERGGRLNRIRPELLQAAAERAIADKAREMGLYGRY